MLPAIRVRPDETRHHGELVARILGEPLEERCGFRKLAAGEVIVAKRELRWQGVRAVGQSFEVHLGVRGAAFEKRQNGLCATGASVSRVQDQGGVQDRSGLS